MCLHILMVKLLFCCFKTCLLAHIYAVANIFSISKRNNHVGGGYDNVVPRVFSIS